MKRAILSVALAMTLITCMFGFCPKAEAAKSNKPQVEEVEYKSNGKVEVDFVDDVEYKNAKVKVTDNKGNTYTTKILRKDYDEIDFKVNNIKQGRTYTFKISGIKSWSESNYTTVSGKFKTPSNKVVIKKVEYDFDDRELSIEFKNYVKYKNAKITVKNASGKKFSARIISKDRDEMEIRASGLKYGNKYTVTVSGVKNADAQSYTSVSKSFYAYDD